MEIQKKNYIIKFQVRTADSPNEWQDVKGDLKLGSLKKPDNADIIELRIKVFDKDEMERNPFRRW